MPTESPDVSSQSDQGVDLVSQYESEHSQPDLVSQFEAESQRPDLTAEALGGKLASPAGFTRALPPEQPAPAVAMPRGRGDVSQAKGGFFPPTDVPIQGVKDIKEGVDDFSGLPVPLTQVPAARGQMPRPVTYKPQLSPEEQTVATQQENQRAKAATKIIQGAGEVGSIALPGAAMVAPIPTVASIVAGTAASKGTGALVHGHMSPEAEDLARSVAFFLPSVLGTAAGVKYSGIESPGGEAKFSGVEAFGGRAKAAYVRTPESFRVGAKVGDTQVEARFPRSQPAPPPEPSEAAKMLGEFQQASGATPTPPPPAPPPQYQGPDHLTPEVAKAVTTNIMKAPPADRPKLMLEAHQNMVRWMINKGTFTGPDGKIYNVDNEGQAKKLASTFINDQVDAADKAAEEASKAPQPLATPAKAPISKPKATTQQPVVAQPLPTTAPVSGKAGGAHPMGKGMTQDSPAVEKVATEATLTPGQEPLVMVKEEKPADVEKLAQPPEPVKPEELAAIGTKDKESGRTILQPSDDVLQNERMAAEAAPELATKLSEISGNVDGARFDRMRPQKNLGRITEKEDADKPPSTIADYSAAQIAADTPEAKDQLVAELHKNFKVLSVEDKFTTGDKDLQNYPSVKVQVQLSNGHTSEVQIVPTEMQEVADHAHHFYSEGRKADAAGDNAKRDEMWAQSEKINTDALDKAKESWKSKGWKADAIASSGENVPDLVSQFEAERQPEHKFASTQINIDPKSELGKAHAAAVANIPHEHVGKEGTEKTPHVTVRYGLKDDSPESIQKIRDAAAKIAPFEVPVGKTDIFPATEHSSFDHPAIARLETTPELKALRSAVESAGGFAEDNFPEYKPHVTLGYIKPEFAQQYKGGNHLEGHKVPVKEITVTKRDGTNEVIPLGGKAENAATPARRSLRERSERRANEVERKRVADMSPEERAKELLTSDAVDLPNKRAFMEKEQDKQAPAVAISDADGLKALNDKFGYDAGTALLRAKAEALKEAGLDAYHDKGDEFVHRGESDKDLSVKLEKAREILKNKVIEAILPDGTVKYFKGADFSYGTGKDLADAESGLKVHKSEREARGERARGELRGIVEVAGGNQDPVPTQRPEVAPPKSSPARQRISKRQDVKRLSGIHPDLVQAFDAWNDGTAYFDNAGNFHRYKLENDGTGRIADSRGPISPWNKTIKAEFKQYGKAATTAFTRAAHAYKGKTAHPRIAEDDDLYAGKPGFTKELEAKYGRNIPDVTAKFDEAIEHTGADVREGRPSPEFADKIKAATHLEPGNDPELKDNFKGAAYQREYFKAALEPALGAWKSHLSEADFQKGMKSADSYVTQKAAGTDKKGRTTYEPNYPEGQTTAQIYVKVPGDGHFLVNNTPYAITKAIKGATQGFAKFTPKDFDKAAKTPSLKPTETDKQRYISRMVDEISNASTPEEKDAARDTLENIQGFRPPQGAPKPGDIVELDGMRHIVVTAGTEWNKAAVVTPENSRLGKDIIDWDKNGRLKQDERFQDHSRIDKEGQRASWYVLNKVGEVGKKSAIANAPVKGKAAEAGFAKMDIPEVFTEGAAKVAKSFFEKDLKPITQGVVGGLKEVVKLGLNTIAPRMTAPPQSLDVAMKMKGQREEELFRFDRTMDALHTMFDKMGTEGNVRFIDDMMRGRNQASPELDEVAQALRQVQERFRAMERPFLAVNQETGERGTDKENYFHLKWKVLPSGVDEEGNIIEGTGGEKTYTGSSTRPLQGGRSFMKRKTLPDASTGIARGRELISTNPIDLVRHRVEESLKFTTARKAWEEHKSTPYTVDDSGRILHISQFFKKGSDRDARALGYDELNDSIAKVMFPAGSGEGMIDAGKYWVEANTARLYNNFLSRDLVRENAAGRGLVAIKNGVTAWKLGFSPFHAITESMLSVGSEIGRGYEHAFNQGIRQGSPTEFARGLGIAVKGVAAPVTAAREGGKAVRYVTDPDAFLQTSGGKDWLKQYPEANELITDLFTGGAKLGMHEDFRINALQGLRQEIADNNYIGAAFRAPMALNQTLQHPLFEVYIPRLKVGMFLREYSQALADRADELAAGKLNRAKLSRDIWDGVEHRFGELNWDNFFWNRTFKTSNQLLWRAFSWTYGNAKFIQKAATGQAQEIIEAAKYWKDAYDHTAGTGEQKAKPGTTAIPRLDRNMAKMLGMLTVGIAVHTALQLYFTHELPKDHKDLIAPRDGTKDKNGQDNRWSAPLVPFKDIESAVNNPGHYVKGKFADIWTDVPETINNRDFNNHLISHPSDPAWEQMYDRALHVVGSPIGYSKFRQEKKQGSDTETALLGTVGITRVSKNTTATPAEKKMREIRASHFGPMTDEELEAREQKDARIAAGNLTRHERQKQRNDARKNMFEKDMEQFSYDQVKQVYDLANPDEQAMMRRILLQKRFARTR